jgi:hypothetical protein
MLIGPLSGYINMPSCPIIICDAVAAVRAPIPCPDVIPVGGHLVANICEIP